MAQNTDILDLGRIGLESGAGRHLDLTVAIDDLELGGQRYTAVSEVPVQLDVAKMPGGHSLRLRAEVVLSGPCMRCLEDAGRRVTIDTREIDQSGGGEELESPYIDGDDLDLRSWARDAVALELPTQIICAEDCKGICSICGENLNTAAPDHHHEKAPDPRWNKLGELRFE
ncbi:MAG: hypothetical protein QOF37_832 [Thermoleophilaceae bacterium]|jgi:uncharacterized protein|nr:hypothetical protein [Thermoleophilaceae bacterium]